MSDFPSDLNLLIICLTDKLEQLNNLAKFKEIKKCFNSKRLKL